MSRNHFLGILLCLHFNKHGKTRAAEDKKYIYKKKDIYKEICIKKIADKTILTLNWTTFDTLVVNYLLIRGWFCGGFCFSNTSKVKGTVTGFPMWTWWFVCCFWYLLWKVHVSKVVPHLMLSKGHALFINIYYNSFEIVDVDIVVIKKPYLIT